MAGVSREVRELRAHVVSLEGEVGGLNRELVNVRESLREEIGTSNRLRNEAENAKGEAAANRRMYERAQEKATGYEQALKNAGADKHQLQVNLDATLRDVEKWRDRAMRAEGYADALLDEKYPARPQFIGRGNRTEGPRHG